MDESDFEGTLILEKLAEVGAVEDFFAAIDADDFGKVRTLLKRANVAASEIELVIRLMDEFN